jgi:2'-5' RNA ligase
VPRLRLGVAILVPAPHDAAVDGLRGAVADPALGRIPAHLTLVPPVNVREDRLDDALGVLRAAAGTVEAFRLRLGPPATFLPVNPVLYLPVVGDPDDPGLLSLHRLRDAVFSDPLARPLSWPFVPHVTLADQAAPERIVAAQAALADFHLEFDVTRLHLLREGAERRWEAIADAELGRAAVIGRGGLELELTRSEHPDPLAARALGDEPFCITARRHGRVVGMALGFIAAGPETASRDAFLQRLVVPEPERDQGIGSHLVAAAEAWAAERGCQSIATEAPAGSRLEAYFAGRGWIAGAGSPGSRLRRDLRRRGSS